MFAHQVIDGLLWVVGKLDKINYIKDEAMKNNTKAFTLSSIEELKKAEKFYLGDFASMRDVFKSKVTHDSSIFFGPFGVDVRLPYKNCWFDWRIDDGGIDFDFRASRRGALVREVGPRFLYIELYYYLDSLKRWLPNMHHYFVGVAEDLSQIDQGELYNVCVGTSYYKRVVNNDAWVGFCNVYNVNSPQSKNIIPLPDIHYIMNNIDDPVDAVSLYEKEHKNSDAQDLVMLNFGLMLLSCRNIGYADHLPSVKGNKKRKRRGNSPVFKYKTLHLKLPKKGGGMAGGGSAGFGQPLHLCRGHFKTYTKEKPLFGTTVGRYWWQPSVRGSKKNGVVVKDYTVETE